MANVCPTTGTYSREYMRECLVISICNKPTREDRKRFLTLYGKKHGLKAGLKLETEVRQKWAKMREEKQC